MTLMRTLFFESMAKPLVGSSVYWYIIYTHFTTLVLQVKLKGNKWCVHLPPPFCKLMFFKCSTKNAKSGTLETTGRFQVQYSYKRASFTALGEALGGC